MKAGICILAGGQSRRMGRDKARLRLGDRTLLGHVRAAAGATGLPVRVIRKDVVPRCGPLGGIYTALKTSRNQAEILLSCDMPFVTAKLIRDLLGAFVREGRAILVEHRRIAGFPLILSVGQIGVVEREITAGQHSLQNLARKLRAGRLCLPKERAPQVFNINTPKDLEAARRFKKMAPMDLKQSPRQTWGSGSRW